LSLGHDASALLGLARIQRQRGDFELAIQSYGRVLARKPEDAGTIAQIGETLREAKGVEAALAYLQTQLSAHPEAKEIACAIQRLTDRP
jgi:tetratricopeptide (TPR) repeat protein